MRPEIARFIKIHSKPPREAVLADVELYRGRTFEECGRDIHIVCESAMHLLAGRPDRKEVLEEKEPPHPSYRAIIERLRVRWAPKTA